MKFMPQRPYQEPSGCWVRRRYSTPAATRLLLAAVSPSCASLETQGAVVGERNVVEIIFEIVDVEGGPATVTALHALDPFAAACDRHIIFFCAGGTPHPVHRHDDHSGVVEIRII